MKYGKHDCDIAAERFARTIGKKLGRENGDFFVSRQQGYRLMEAMECGGEKSALTDYFLPAQEFCVLLNAAETALEKYGKAK